LLANEGFQTIAVFALEGPKLVDLTFQGGTLGREARNRPMVVVLRFLNNAGRLSVPFGDNLIPLLNSLTNVLLVEPARELQEIVGIFSLKNISPGTGQRVHPDRGGGTTCALQLRDSCFAGGQLLDEIFVLCKDTTHLDNNIIEKVIDLVLVVAFAKVGWLKPLVDYVFWCKWHFSFPLSNASAMNL
jgi:hypothetical protein